MIKLNQKGFAAFEAVLIVITLVAIGAAGYFAYQARQDKSDATRTSTETVKQNNANRGQAANSNELIIKEWGIKINARDSSKLSYSVSNVSGSQTGLEYESSVKPSIKAEFLQNKSCEIGVGIFRTKLPIASYKNKQVGDYYYFITGAPGTCSDDPDNNPDDLLKKRILADLVPENISAE